MTPALRVARRFLVATLEMGRTVFLGTLKIHRFRDHFRFTDMTNAGKRGKKVRELALSPSYYMSEAEREECLDRVAADVTRYTSYDAVLAYANKLKAEESIKWDLSESALRGVDVEPMGTTITVKTKTDLEIKASPQDFSVMHHAKLSNGHYQDTNYWPAKKQDGTVFYAWLKDNLSRANSMTIQDFTELWHNLGVRYNSH